MGNFINKLGAYQVIPRELIFDNTLSDRARFVYCYMASKPNDWDFLMTPMANEIGYSVDTLRKYINELIGSGWLIKGEQKNNGLFGAVTYTLNSTKISDTEKIRYGEIPTQHNIDNRQNTDSKQKEEIDKSISKKAEIADFVERMYKLYPSRCPKRDTSLGKSIKDKERIKKLLKLYSMEQIEKVIRYEVDTKYGKCRMYNFSTFLNNFPDPTQIDCGEYSIHTEDSEDSDKLIISGVEYR